MATELSVSLVDAWRIPEAGEFFRNVWPMYVHELSEFDPTFYVLDETGRWLPHLADDWVSSSCNRRKPSCFARRPAIRRREG